MLLVEVEKAANWDLIARSSIHSKTPISARKQVQPPATSKKGRSRKGGTHPVQGMTEQDRARQKVIGAQRAEQRRQRRQMGAPSYAQEQWKPDTKVPVASNRRQKAVNAWRRDRGAILAPTAVVGGAAVAADRVVPRRDYALAKRDERRTNETSVRAMTAAGVGTAAHLGVGYHLKHMGNKRINDFEAANPGFNPKTGAKPNKARQDYDRDLSRHQRKQGVRATPGSDKQRYQMSVTPDYNRKMPKHLPGAKYKNALGQLSGKRGVAVGAAFAAVPAAGSIMVDRARSKTDVGKRQLKATEFEAGNSHERLSAEGQRRRVAGTGMALGVAGTAAGAGATSLALYRHAGRDTPQAGLKAAATTHPNPGVRSFAATTARRGAKARAGGLKTTAGIVGLSAASAGLGVSARFRRSEEEGISQGLGRIKAGQQYDRDLKRIGKLYVETDGKSWRDGNSGSGPYFEPRRAKRVKRYTIGKSLPRAAGLGGAVIGVPELERVTRGALKHKEALTLLAVGGTGAVAGRSVKVHRREREAVRAKLGKAATYGVQEKTFSPLRGAELVLGVGSIAWGGSRVKMTGKLLRSGAKKVGVKGRGKQIDEAMASVRRVTGHGSRQISRIPGAGTAAAVVPSKMRPVAALAGGAYLTYDAVPVQRSTFHPTRRF